MGPGEPKCLIWGQGVPKLAIIKRKKENPKSNSSCQGLQWGLNKSLNQSL